MTSERWKQIEAVFEQALELPAEQRTAFLQSSCDGDEELRREVQSLLDAHARAGSFIDEPSLFVARDESDERDAAVANGQLIGAYRVVRELGRGGMGAVYLAERADKQYRKRVAIKLVKRGTDTDAVLWRFRNERQILANFDHANIAGLFDAGTTADGLPYFVMEYVEGVSIDKYCDAHRVSIPERLKLFREVCAAVAYAHRCGVIHRDIKSSNIVVTAEGVPKLVDFGIAKILQPAIGAETLLTTTDHRPMTPQYASPEQVRGERLTPATDVYSLGVVLYELLTRQMPYRFVSQSPHDVARAITEQEPTRPSTASAKSPGSSKSQVPNPKLLRGDLDNIVLKALRKEPKQRYQSVEQLSEDIRCHLEGRPITARPVLAAARVWRWSRRNPILAGAAGVCLVLALAVVWLLREQFNAPKTAVPEKSIALLPFEYLSADKTDAYLADGIQEEILTRLSKVADLKVISHTSTQRYNSKPENLPEIARQLGVTHILEGSVQKTGDQLRVNAQLIDAQTDSHLWADQFDRKLTDIFAVESEIATKIVQTLQPKLTGSEQAGIAARQTQDTEAHELYLKGRFFFDKRTVDDMKKAIEFFKQALAKDPNYAAAYAGIADVYALLPGYAGGSVKEAIANARAAAEKALAIDNDLAEAHSALALSLTGDFDLQAARREFERAIELNPNYAAAHYGLGFSVLGPLGQFDAAIAEMKRAVELDPLSVTMNGNLAYCYIFARRYPEAIAAADKAIELDARNPKGQDVLAIGLELSGHVTEAIAQYERSFEASGGDYHSLWFLSRLYGLRGERTKALQTFEKAKQIQQKQGIELGYGYALMNIGLGNYEEAIKWLERSYERKENVVPCCYLVADPMLDPLRGNPRFEKLAKQIASELNATPRPEKSVAVLPFKSLMPENRDPVLEMGMADTLITKLSNSREIIVPSLASIRKYGGLDQDPIAAGRELGVGSVLEGNLERSGDRIRVSTRLIKVADGSSLWAGTFDEKFTDVFAVQDAISQKVADALALRLSSEEKARLTKRYTDNLEAYQLYLTGRYHFAKLIPPEIRTAIDFFQQAIQRDPNYAMAYFGLAEANRALAITSDVPSKEALPRAKEAAMKALAIDDGLAEAHVSLSFILVWYEWDWQGGENEARRAVALNPNSGLAHWALAHVLSDLGRHDEALAEAHRASQLEPVFLLIRALEGMFLLHAHHGDEAMSTLQEALELDPNFWVTHLTLGKVYAKQRKYPEALAEFTKAKELSHGNSETIGSIGYVAALAGDKTRAMSVLDEFKTRSVQSYIPPCNVALVYNGLGDQNEAIRFLEKAIDDRDVRLTLLKVDPRWDSFRSNPQFIAILKRIGLE